MSEARVQILQAMSRLIEKQGYHATGLNEIIRESGAPKGSVYYYFPGGKEQMCVEAITEAGDLIAGRLRMVLNQETGAIQAIPTFLLRMADSIEVSGFSGGSPLTTVALETAATSDTINIACRDAFDKIHAVFRDKFMTDGLSETRASELATFVMLVIEGGILLGRTYHDVSPIRVAARQLQEFLSTQASSS